MERQVDHMQRHWDRVYRNRVETLGWYEETPEPSFSLINSCQLPKNARMLHTGAGATTLIDYMLAAGYSNQIAVDISGSAIRLLKERLGEKQDQLEYIRDDLIHSRKLINMDPVDLWHDRAVLHFFTNEKDRTAYFNLVRKLLRKGGFIIIAAFNEMGAEKCSGLPVYRYNSEMLQRCLGEEFKLLKAFDHTYSQPSGDTREYLYTLFQRST